MHAARRVITFQGMRPYDSRGFAARLALIAAFLALAAVASAAARAQEPRRAPATRPSDTDPLARFALPDSWEAEFWSLPGVKELLALDPKALADLVPAQAGLRYCRCPGCEAAESDDPLAWSLQKPAVLTCRRCGLTVPNDDIPARDDKKKVPEETVEVLPRVLHHYPYHLVPAEKQRYPDERLYLDAKRDYEARALLAKAALYAAVRHHEQPPEARQAGLARLAAVIVLRFAQVYPAYATHYDQPGEPKYFQQADLPPPYRRGYRTGKWDSTANLDVPMNLLIAYVLIKGDPALLEAGNALGDPNPARTIEHDLFRSSAGFVRLQTEEFGEMSLTAYRGLLAVGRLLGDPSLVHEALLRLGAFAERGFYHDGFWRQASASAHQRVVGLFDGWIDPLLFGSGGPKTGPRVAEVPMLALARSASAVTFTDPTATDVLRASLPLAEVETVPRHPALLGGAGLARLALGQGPDALDLELRGLDAHGEPHFQRQAIRLSLGGRPVLGDLDELPPTASGWDRASASHNTIVVDGLNQRESIARARAPAPGGRFLFFAAEPDFQVARLDDPNAYPQSTTRYRQTLVGATTATTRYAVSVFEVHGGLQHDQLFHSATGAPALWEMPVAWENAPASLLPPSIAYIPGARADEGRWFVQAYGELALQGQLRLFKPATARLNRPDGPGVRLHLLGDMPLVAYGALSNDPTAGMNAGPSRAGLILRRRSETGATLKSTFVTVFEPLGTSSAPLLRVGRVASSAETVVVYIVTPEGNEHLVVNLNPGTIQEVTLADGRKLRTDGLAARVTTRDLMLAGGSFAETGPRRTGQSLAAGSIIAVSRGSTAAGRGWFLTEEPVADADTLVGRTVLIEHGDGTTRGWTLTRVENIDDRARLHVHEEPGFVIDGDSGAARYYQFPRDTAPGPHRFTVSKIARASRTGPLHAVDLGP